ncbi:MAG: glycosyltransferase family 4 protein [Rhizobacter sp.]|nr:glycosyltransferase family 4 protein [Rhizobacter sp.]
MKWKDFWPKKRSARDHVVVLDDFFPNLLTGFRVAEYNAYLETFPHARVLSTLKSFEKEHARYKERYPHLAARVAKFSRSGLRNAACAYLNFLNNAALFVPELERLGIPFAMTLYPGGGFGLDELASDVKLLRVLRSPLLRSLVVTQPITDAYVRKFARLHQVQLPSMHRIAGGVINPAYFDTRAPLHGPYFGEGKDIFDICFVAEKYMPRGENKGYPAFVNLALALRHETCVRFTVVGGFGPSDIDVGPLGDRFRFAGYLETSELPSFFAGIDLVVSPNRPYVLHPGNFDGFPTGACVEASLCGAAIMAADELHLNPGYLDGESMLIVPPDTEALLRRTRALLDQPETLGPIARSGQQVTKRLFAPDIQIGQRLQVLRALAESSGLTC